MIYVHKIERVAGNIFKAIVYQNDVDRKYFRGDVIYFNEFTARDNAKYNGEILSMESRHFISEDEKQDHLSETGYPDEY